MSFFSSLNGMALSNEYSSPDFAFCKDLLKKELPISLITHDLGLDMTSSIPPFQALFAGLINVPVATHSSLRAISKRMISNPEVMIVNSLFHHVKNPSDKFSGHRHPSNLLTCSFQPPASRFKFDLLISSVVTVAHRKIQEVPHADH